MLRVPMAPVIINGSDFAISEMFWAEMAVDSSNAMAKRADPFLALPLREGEVSSARSLCKFIVTNFLNRKGNYPIPHNREGEGRVCYRSLLHDLVSIRDNDAMVVSSHFLSGQVVGIVCFLWQLLHVLDAIDDTTSAELDRSTE